MMGEWWLNIFFCGIHPMPTSYHDWGCFVQLIVQILGTRHVSPSKIAERNERWFDHVTINRGHWELVLIINLSQNAGLGGTRKPRNLFFFNPKYPQLEFFSP